MNHIEPFAPIVALVLAFLSAWLTAYSVFDTLMFRSPRGWSGYTGYVGLWFFHLGVTATLAWAAWRLTQ